MQIDCTNSCFWNNLSVPSDTIWVDFTCDGKTTPLVTGTNDWPGDGTNASPPGRPGRGGNGGTLTSTLENMGTLPGSNTFGAAGPNGNIAPTAHGGSPGQPVPARRLHLICNFSSDGSTLTGCTSNSEVHNAQAGQDAPGLPAIGSAAAGAVNQTADTNRTWLHPIAARAILDYMKDVYAAGNLSLARSIGADYLPLFQQSAADAGNPNQSDFSQDAMECEQYMSRLDSNLDFYGNPAGWVPLLSLAANFTALQNEVTASAPMLYLSYWMQQYANDQQTNLQAINASKTALWSDVQAAQRQYATAAAALPGLQSMAGSVQNQIGQDEKTLTALEAALTQRATQDVMAANALPDWKKALRVLSQICSVIPVNQPALGAVGAGLNFATNVDPNQPIAGFQQGLQVASSFTSQQFNNANANLSSPLASLGPEGQAASAAVGGITSTLTNMSTAIDSIRQTLGPPAAPADQVVEQLQKIEALDPSFQSIVQEITQLNARKTTLATNISSLLDALSQSSQTISADLLTITQLDRTLQKSVKTMDLTTVTQVKEMGRRATERLQKDLYYMAKSYEYSLLQPYPGDLNLSKFVSKLQSFVTANNGAIPNFIDQSQFNLLLAPYADALRQVVNDGIAAAQVNQVNQLNGNTFTLTSDELNTLNTQKTVTIDLSRKLSSLGTFEQKRLANIGISVAPGDITVSPANSADQILLSLQPVGQSVLSSSFSIATSKQFAYAFQIRYPAEPESVRLE